MSNILNYSFSFFPSVFKNASEQLDLYDLKQLIISKSTPHFSIISKIRKASDEKMRAELKMQLSAVSVSAVIMGKRCAENIVRHSSLLGIDLDDIEDIDSTRALLVKDPYVVSLFLSPSGNGLKLIFLIDGEKHLNYFLAISKYLKEKYNLTVDAKCKDVARLIFLSYDPNFFLNQDASQFTLIEFLPYPIRNGRAFAEEQVIKDFIAIVDEIELKCIDITSDYDDWLKIGFVCADLFREGGGEYYHRISKFNPQYVFSVTEKQFLSCLIHNGNGVTPKTFFYIAKKYGIPQLNINLGSNKSEQNGEDDKHKFWWIKTTSKGTTLEINYTRLNALLLHLGFRRFDIGLNRIFVKIENKVVEEAAIHQIQDALISYINQLPEDLGDGATSFQLLEKIYRNPAHYFNDNRLTLLNKGEEFIFNKDTNDASFIYFKNGFVRVTSEGWELFDYTILDKYIWRKQILSRDFVHQELKADNSHEHGIFSIFLKNISGNSTERYNILLTIIGYLLHQYFDTRMRCLILTDSKISDLPEGRTGKTLISKALGKIRSYSEVDGKSFDHANRFKWQEVELSTQVVGLNDVKANFNIDVLFTAITEGFKVEVKNIPAKYIQAKLLVTSNRTVITDGDSRKDRCIEFEVSDYYSAKFSPKDEFNCWFFTDWDKNEWVKFDNLMMFAIQQYFTKGLLMPEQINLDRRKLLEQTNSDFVEYMDDQFSTGKIKVNQEVKKKYLHEQFLNDYPDYKDARILGTMRGFTNYLRIYSKYSYRVSEVVPKRDERKSGSEYFITFRP